MKILHIYDTAGVSSTLAHYQSKLGHDATVLLGRHDAFGRSEYYSNQNSARFLVLPGEEFRSWLSSHAREYDVFHLHSKMNYLLPWLELKHPTKKVFYHLHGGEFSTPPKGKRKLLRELSIILAKCS